MPKHSKSAFFPYTFFEGKFVPTDQAKVPIMTNALQYATAVLGGIRGYYNQDKKFLSIFRIDTHYRRLLQSLKILGVTIDYDLQKLIDIHLKLVAKNKPREDVYFRPFAYASSLNLSPNLDRDSKFGYALYMIPLGDYLDVQKGLRIATTSWQRISDSSIPSRGKYSAAYLNSALARRETARLGFDEALFLTKEGSIAEGSAENFFMVRDGVLITPAKSHDIVEGIVRRSILELARDLGIPTEEREIDRSEGYIAEEAFFTGTGVQLAWISSIDNRPVGSGKRGPITSKLQNLYFEIVRGNNSKYAHWCTKITL